MEAPPIELRSEHDDTTDTENYTWVSLGPCKSYNVYHDPHLHLPKSTSNNQQPQDLEKKAFESLHVDKDRQNVHFHFQGHDRCEARAKPNLWDKGSYFVQKLLQDGSLRLIPHFSEKKARGREEKRDVSSPGTSIGCLGVEREVDMGSKTDDHSLSDTVDEDYPFTTSQPHLHPRSGQYVHASQLSSKFNHSIPRLSPNATYTTWLSDFDRIKQDHVGDKFANVTPAQKRSLEKAIHRRVHQCLINGKYGIPASKPCVACVRRGLTCRVYHPDCYLWVMSGIGGARTQLGWRCALCRLQERGEGCNVQWEGGLEGEVIELRRWKSGGEGKWDDGEGQKVASKEDRIDREKYHELLRELGMHCQDS
ncbi:hypothetical protein P153DRAFT_358557 [Dothidotthia symphoricarpi CBS 119687]|uniref:Uncharacterized protein n=1 Tax=Dothidotthia symphoricarpi CBS 119687 TaxID=1392245 RepID=A0A6A6AA16_9PLEO|nr:uncharacterized protein P153DRAFT_358557 [Dothidotthia symphoricarpi CBS 119687]KAF2127708.1 hypothetical protein P153DRAFT_358557 [Dothidotthia symphoricarpi CBS 119687]